MSKFTIRTEDLIDFLDTLLVTADSGKDADPALEGVYLYPEQGSFGEEPGNHAILAGLSTNGALGSHYYVIMEGGSFSPVFWPSRVIGLVMSAFVAFTADNPEHAVTVEHLPGGEVHVREYSPDGSPSEVVLQFHIPEFNSFPASSLVSMLNGVSSKTISGVDGEEIDKQAPGQTWSKGTLGVFLNLAKSWKNELILQPRGGGKSALVQMSMLHNWIGVVVPPSISRAELLNSGVTVDTRLNIPQA